MPDTAGYKNNREARVELAKIEANAAQLKRLVKKADPRDVKTVVELGRTLARLEYSLHRNAANPVLRERHLKNQQRFDRIADAAHQGLEMLRETA